MELQLNEKSVLISGGSKGIGLATARTFAAEGTSLHLAARNIEDLQKAKKEVEDEFGVPVSIHAVDLSSGDT
ncbi:MAG: SDR family NAD(P)-dependent oxidoreductase, partial [Desulfobulbia bacterium]